MRRFGLGAVTALICGAGWMTGAWLIFVEDVGSGGLLSAAGLSATVLFFGVPLLTFMPPARRWQAPFLEIEAAIGWGLSAVVVAFVEPAYTAPMWQILLVLAPLTIALATVCTAVAHAVAGRLVSATEPLSFVDSRRRGYLAASGLIALAMLAGLRVLAPVIALLLVAVCVLVETLISARGRGEPPIARKPSTGRSVRSIPES